MANDVVYGTILPFVGTILAWILSLAPISAIRVSCLCWRGGWVVVVVVCMCAAGGGGGVNE